MTPQEFKRARRKLGLSTPQTAELLEIAEAKTIRRWEAGERDIPGPAAVLMRWLAFGQKPIVPEGRYNQPGRPADDE